MKNGEWIFYYENGNKQLICSFISDRQEGKVTAWHEVGTLESVKYYKNGRPDGTWEFYGKREGDLIKSMKFKKGVKITE